MSKQPKKEDILKQLAILQSEVEHLTAQDQSVRKEFAKAFRWHKLLKPYSGGYNEPAEPILPSWAQVWVNLGTLLAVRDFRDYEGNISALELEIEELKRKITTKNHE